MLNQRRDGFARQRFQLPVPRKLRKQGIRLCRAALRILDLRGKPFQLPVKRCQPAGVLCLECVVFLTRQVAAFPVRVERQTELFRFVPFRTEPCLLPPQPRRSVPLWAVLPQLGEQGVHFHRQRDLLPQSGQDGGFQAVAA